MGPETARPTRTKNPRNNDNVTSRDASDSSFRPELLLNFTERGENRVVPLSLTRDCSRASHSTRKTKAFLEDKESVYLPYPLLKQQHQGRGRDSPIRRVRKKKGSLSFELDSGRLNCGTSNQRFRQTLFRGLCVSTIHFHILFDIVTQSVQA